MAIPKQTYGDRVAQWAEKKGGGEVTTPGPFLGVVKNNLDPTRSGRLQIYIPDLGGDENETQNWRTVFYASPFYGSTFQPESTEITAHDKVHHNYGMWAIPPDIGNEVLCIFINGDPDRGYWFACVDKHLSHNGLPSPNSRFDVSPQEIGTVQSGLVKASNALGRKQPSGEFNEAKPGNVGRTYLNNARSIHEYQAEILINQGIDGDTVRGPVSSSSQRETPSMVFGISTPGRPTSDPSLDPDYKQRLERGELTEEDYAIRQRRGGHSIILDDGDINAQNQILRLRSSGGHQLLFVDDTKDAKGGDNHPTGPIIQLIHGNGSSWLEFDSDGNLFVYAYKGIHLRTEGELNLHADDNINVHTEKNFNIHADGDINIDSQKNTTIKTNLKLTEYAGNIDVGTGGNYTLSAGSKINQTSGGDGNYFSKRIDLNTSPGPTIPDPGNLKKFFHEDVTRGSLSTPWTVVKNAKISINSVVPAHEPWKRQTGLAVTDTGFIVGQQLEAAESARQEALTADTFANTFSTIAGGSSPPSTGSNAGQSSSGAAATGTAKPLGGGAGTGKPPTGAPKTTAPSSDSGPTSAQGSGVSKGIKPGDVSRKDAPPVTSGVAGLTPEQTQALKTQIAKNESGFDYGAVNQFNYLGRYQVGGAVLQDQGLLRPEYVKKYGNKAALYPEAWTAKAHSMGITSQADFLANGAVQEQVMDNLLVSNAKTLGRIGGIRPGDSAGTTAGMLQTAHLLGAGGAKKWRNGGGGADANGTTGAMYFNRGRHAVENVASA